MSTRYKAAVVDVDSAVAKSSATEVDLMLPLDNTQDDPVLDLPALFDNDNVVEIELGIGKGRYLLDAAQSNPAVNYIGVEVAGKYLRLAHGRACRRHLSNVRFVHGDAKEFVEFFLPTESVHAFHIYFPDPWPKKRHHKRRLVNKGFLNSLARTMCDDATFHFSTDHDEYGRWVLRFLLEHQAFDWSGRGPRDWRVRPSGGIVTRYERKALTAGRTCVYLQFRRRQRAQDRLENCS